MPPRTAEQKTRLIIRIASIPSMLAGVWFAFWAAEMIIGLVRELRHPEWTHFALSVAMLPEMALTAFFIYAGWSNLRRPESANPRLLLISCFILLWFVLNAIGLGYLSRHTPAQDLRRMEDLWFGCISFGLMAFCSALHYACVRWLQRQPGLSDVQRAALARPPSRHWFGFMGLWLFFGLLELVTSHDFYLQTQSSFWILLIGFIASWYLYRRTWHATCNWLAPPAAEP